jgi:hypothetical protein
MVDLVGLDKANHNKAKRMEAIVKNICYSRMEMEMTQNAIIMDGFGEWENVLCQHGEHLTCMIEVWDEFDYDIFFKIKGDTTTEQGFVIDGDMGFVSCVGFDGEGSCQ